MYWGGDLAQLINNKKIKSTYKQPQICEQPAHPGKHYNHICDESISNISSSSNRNQKRLFLPAQPFSQSHSSRLAAATTKQISFPTYIYISSTKKGLNRSLKYFPSVKNRRIRGFSPEGEDAEAAERSGCNLWHATEPCQKTYFMDLRGPVGGFQGVQSS